MRCIVYALLVAWFMLVQCVLSEDPSSLLITFHNKLNEDLDIYWLDPNTRSRTHIVILPKLTQQNINSYDGHTFKLVGNLSGKDVHTVTIEAGKTSYYIGENKDAEFLDAYHEATGKEWLNVVPREPTNNFIWPAPRKSYKHLVNLWPPHWHKDDAKKVAPLSSELFPADAQLGYLEVKGTVPKIFFIEDFLSADECDYLVDLIKPGLQRSTVSSAAKLDENRTSRTVWLSHNSDPVLQNIIQRSFNLLRIPYNPSNSSLAAESLQGLHYSKTQWYREHHDYFPPGDADNVHDPHIQAGNNRLATLFFYLTDVEEGGETYFPRYDGGYVDNGCTNPDGFRVRPKKGAATLFYSMTEDGNLDVQSLHGGCPVIKGDKYASNLWFWDRKFK